jgi:PAS domain S-box-containing protein
MTAQPVILIVEDEVAIAKDLARQLTRAGYSISGPVSYGQHAIDKADETEPDLVLMDIRLRGDMDGIEAANRIRIRHDVPIVYLTASSDERVFARAKVSGPLAYLTKPVASNDLIHAIEMSLHRHEIERRLRESEARYRLLADHATDVISSLSPDGKILYCSPAAERMFGYDLSKDLLGRSLYELAHSDDLESLQAAHREVLQGSGLVNVTCRLRRKDGTFVWCETTVRGILDSGTGQILGGVAVSRDIALRKMLEDEVTRARDQLELRVAERTAELSTANEALRTEISSRRMAEAALAAANKLLQGQADELRLSEEKYRTLVETLNDVIYEIDELGTIRYVSPTVRNILEYECHEVVGRNVIEFIHPEHSEKMSQRLRELIEGVEEPGEYMMMTKSGEVRWVRTYTKLILAETGLTARGTLVDITQRKLAEEKLAESQGQFRAIFDSAQDCIFVKDRSLRYVLVNPFMESFLALPASEMLGRSDEDLFQPGEGLRAGATDQRVLKGESVEVERTSLIRGEKFTLLETRVPMRNASGEVVGLCGISRNITERKIEPWRPSIGDHGPCSKAMRKTLELAQTVARTDATILLTGESGCGKDHLARYIHDNSLRADGPFFSLNCAALPHELAESELFGHEAGAFTGARTRKRGLLELAEGGTLLLNEIGELTLPLQAKLLTFLDTKTLVKVGGERSISVNARLVAATNRNLDRAVADGIFRHDLFHRLNVVSIAVPPLRDRREDLPGLVACIVAEITARLQLRNVPEIDSKTLEKLALYHWPGNVRELRNVLERGLILSQGNRLNLDVVGLRPSTVAAPASGLGLPEGQSLTDLIADLKLRHVQEAIARSGGNRNQAARLLGMTRFSLTRMMKSLGLLTPEHSPRTSD